MKVSDLIRALPLTGMWVFPVIEYRLRKNESPSTAPGSRWVIPNPKVIWRRIQKEIPVTRRKHGAF